MDEEPHFQRKKFNTNFQQIFEDFPKFKTINFLKLREMFHWKETQLRANQLLKQNHLEKCGGLKEIISRHDVQTCVTFARENQRNHKTQEF